MTFVSCADQENFVKKGWGGVPKNSFICQLGDGGGPREEYFS